LRVGPQALEPEHPLARLRSQEMGFVLYSDIAGRTAVLGLEHGPVGTCQAMIRDLLEIVTE
jgi:homoserine dehydrogenase